MAGQCRLQQRKWGAVAAALVALIVVTDGGEVIGRYAEAGRGLRARAAGWVTPSWTTSVRAGGGRINVRAIAMRELQCPSCSRGPPPLLLLCLRGGAKAVGNGGGGGEAGEAGGRRRGGKREEAPTEDEPKAKRARSDGALEDVHKDLPALYVEHQERAAAGEASESSSQHINTTSLLNPAHEQNDVVSAAPLREPLPGKYIGIAERKEGRFSVIHRKREAGVYDLKEHAATAYDIIAYTSWGAAGADTRGGGKLNFRETLEVCDAMRREGKNPMDHVAEAHAAILALREAKPKEKPASVCRWMSYEEARGTVRPLRHESQRAYLRWLTEWRKSAARRLDIPTQPHRIYREAGWVSWEDFLDNLPPTAVSGNSRATAVVTRPKLDQSPVEKASPPKPRTKRSLTVKRLRTRIAAAAAHEDSALEKAREWRRVKRMERVSKQEEEMYTIERLVEKGWGWRMLNITRPETAGVDHRQSILVPKLEEGGGERAMSAREFIQQGGGGGGGGGECLVGARVERADFEIPPSELHREMLERAPTENIRRELLEKEGKEKGYDMRLWKRIMETVRNCPGCNARPLVMESYVRNTRDAMFATNVCVKCKYQADGPIWHTVHERPQKSDLSEMRHTLIADRLRKGKTLLRKETHLNEHRWCSHDREAMRLEDFAENDAIVRGMLGKGIKDIIPDRETLFVPRPLTFDKDELRVLREAGVPETQLPPTGRIFCTECQPAFEERCRDSVMQMAILDNFELIKDVYRNRTFFFQSDPLTFMRYEELKRYYQQDGQLGVDPERPEQDCTIPYISPFMQPNLNPEVYQHTNSYLEDITDRHRDEVSEVIRGAEDRATREKLFARIQLYAYDALRGQNCTHLQALSDEITLKWSPTGILLEDENAKQRPFRPSYVPRDSESDEEQCGREIEISSLDSSASVESSKVGKEDNVGQSKGGVYDPLHEC